MVDTDTPVSLAISLIEFLPFLICLTTSGYLAWRSSLVRALPFDFFRKCETSFDKRTGYDRAPEQTFDYLNTMKNGSPKEIFQKKEWAERVNHERLEKMKAEWNRDLQEPHQEQGREESQQQGNSISQVPEINQVPQRKKQQEEELDQPRKRSRGFGMGMWFYIYIPLVLGLVNSLTLICRVRELTTSSWKSFFCFPKIESIMNIQCRICGLWFLQLVFHYP